MRTFIEGHKHDHPGYGWAALAGLVAVADATGNRTMSEAFKNTSRHKVGGPVITVGWTYLTAHLFGFLPPKYDLFHIAGHTFTGRKCVRCFEGLNKLP